ncbi:acyl-CoA thioesterase [Oceanobacillus salinisoli]|uniref:acyl-CoA thioesterase n=1 Tax=Oceanobacillus salinisoli TaxID=2678611 RepID=UPI0012E2032F|nr:acyl-CoA thioesterase [Oceanobacillus salinisoli]
MVDHEIEVYVRFSETDAMGHVNNVSYFYYFEEARTKFMMELFGGEVEFKSMILASVSCDYIAQAYAAQILKVKSNILRIGNKSFTIMHNLVDANDGRLIAKCTAVLVYFNYEEQVTEELPQIVRNQLENRLVSS